MPKKSKRVREPVQAYLDAPDSLLLEELSARTSLSKAELIRRAIRRLAQEVNVTSRPYSGLGALAGVLDVGTDVPVDLAARHDDYLYGAKPKAAPTRRR